MNHDRGPYREGKGRSNMFLFKEGKYYKREPFPVMSKYLKML